ncbi:Peptidoglycan-associated lipoprotein precursor (19 kDa surface antigen) (PPL) [Legionella lansingensis]|uniref:Peptidoglycan-associated lipoprotein n=1 Tax=Legionella lansingensis TaxID=45067 RepID=A0A0W0VRV0_9GAMM|nr:peptidoglycan-associated lipoprotein Pal [Legionella lansingensis]KTD22903.1 Peptidoglycan-associated lipoprotein precursor (19 kDa surface antigen) (PPL) [Legionella lansingensis]SNV53855.1 Peptidoglycan-associated lipoprotein precursor (19 kDa surface antigen) (PPL) [Legionella lansingensis]
MKARLFFKLGIAAASVVLLASCSKTPGSADGMGAGGASAHGLGQLSRFAGQEPGESYTTQAPHNQIYLFSYDDASFNPKYTASLNAQSEYLKTHPGARVLLAGHTDERGSREYNIALGERRANTVAELMRMAGVGRNQIRVVSYGKERPANLGHDEASHMQNRRVELTYEATR